MTDYVYHIAFVGLFIAIFCAGCGIVADLDRPVDTCHGTLIVGEGGLAKGYCETFNSLYPNHVPMNFGSQQQATEDPATTVCKADKSKVRETFKDF